MVMNLLEGESRLIGDRIRILRIKQGITQETLAKQLHVSPQAVSKWENHIATPDISSLIPLADYFEVTVDYLLRDDQDWQEEITPFLEIKLQKKKNSFAFIGYVKNNSAQRIAVLVFKVKFKNAAGQVIDYREECVYDLEPAEMKQIITFSQAAGNITDTEIEIVKLSAAYDV